MIEARIAGWTSPNGDITIQVWDLGNLFQVREINHLGGPDATTVEPFHRTASGLEEARAVARAKAEIIRWNQTGR